MAAVFQLARVRRTSPSCASSPRVVEIPEATKTLLESLTDPLLVISFFSSSRAVQDAFWSTLRHTYRPSACSGKPADFNGSSSSLTGGIWASLPSAGTGPGTGSGTITDTDGIPVQVLYLIYRDEYGYNDSHPERSIPSGDSESSEHLLAQILCPLLALCSTQLNIVSATMADTEMDVKRLCQPLEILASTQRHGREGVISLAPLGWRWFGSREMTPYEPSSLPSFDASYSNRHSESGFGTIERIIQRNRLTDEGDGQGGSRNEDVLQSPVANLRKLFGSVECHRPWSPLPSLSSSPGKHTPPESTNVSTHLNSELYDMDRVLTQDLRDLTRIDKHANVQYLLEGNHSGRGSLGFESSWFKEATSLEGTLGELGSVSDNPRIVNGAMLYAKMQACLLQLNNQPPTFNRREMRLSMQELVRERALYYGVHAYHRIMNEHLDRQPIPLSWHTLAMIHQDAQSKSLEEIEKKFSAPDCRLPQLLQEFRAHCMETGTAASPGAGSESAGSAATNVVSPMSELEAIVPTGGLYLEYYSANASALQNHHLVTLDEHWQVLLKNRLLSAQNITAAAATTSSLVTPALATTSSSTNIKDHASFLLAVDQVRRNYLETCIPSPEAISVLENLDEMQQAESALLLKSLAAAASAAAASMSPRSSLPVHLRRYSLTSPSSSSQSILPPSIRELRLLTEVLRENKSESHTTHAAVENKSSSSSNSSNGGHVRATTLSTHQMQQMQQMQQLQQAPTELEQQISEILRSKRRANTNELQGSRSNDSTHSSNRQGAQAVVKAQGSSFGSSSTSNGVATASKSSTTAQGRTAALSSATATSGTSSVTSGSNSLLKESDNKSVVQFGWTLHMLHANTLQYAWIWTWLYIHEGSSRQNVVACDSKMYTASKWIILPAKDLVRTRKDWKVSYGDRVWMVSYWFSTRNAKMDLPEYLPRARGAACRHVIPYGETYVICKTCPADILCMRCFRASDHTDHTMYLQCSWGTSVCVCGDPLKLKASNALHCALHCAESQKSYSGLAKGKPCQIKFKAGEKVYRCKTCLVGTDESVVLCPRCFRSHNHFGHEVTAHMAEEGSVCSCHDNKSWRPDLHCTYHSPGVLESEYSPKPFSLCDTPSARHPYSQEQSSSSKKRSKGPSLSGTSRHLERSEPGKNGDQSSTSLSFKPITAKANPIQPHRCGHIFQPGEDIYHCRDCSFNDRVILCSRCFHSSGCVDHRWRMGEFQSQKTRAGEGGSADVPGLDSTGRSISPSITVEGLTIGYSNFNSARTELSQDCGAKPQDASLCPPVSIAEDVSASYGGSVGASCDCGDPEMFKTVFDCNYHLPQEYRPVPSLIHCNYLFQQGETMLRCRTCHFDGTDTDAFAADLQGQDNGLHAEALDQEFLNRGPGSCLEADVWICERCFDPEQHIGHVLEEAVNHQNRGAYCHCGDVAILKDPHARSSAVASSVPGAILAESEALYPCKDDHNRQNMLCTTDIKEGMLYYSCKTCQTDLKRVFCEPCFIKEAHKDHEYEQLPATTGFEPIRCGCGENSAFRYATHCRQHERSGGTNIVHRCRYRAREGEWIAYCRDCYPHKEGQVAPYICQRCRQTSHHAGHDIKWVRAERDLHRPCACGSVPNYTQIVAAVDHTEPPLDTDSCATPMTAVPSNLPPPSISISDSSRRDANLIRAPPLCQYHTMIYKTTPSTTLYLHSHDYRSINHQDHSEVTGYRYHDSNNDWIVTRPDEGDDSGSGDDDDDGDSGVVEHDKDENHAHQNGRGNAKSIKTVSGSLSSTTKQHVAAPSPFLQWKDVFWLKHAATGKYFNSMASLKISQGFQEVSAFGAPHSNNDWIIEETTWLRQQILSDE